MCQLHVPAALPPGQPWYSLCRRLGGARVGLEAVEKGKADVPTDNRILIPQPSRPQYFATRTELTF
jgi:hypothetical protein